MWYGIWIRAANRRQDIPKIGEQWLRGASEEEAQVSEEMDTDMATPKSMGNPQNQGVAIFGSQSQSAHNMETNQENVANNTEITDMHRGDVNGKGVLHSIVEIVDQKRQHTEGTA